MESISPGREEGVFDMHSDAYQFGFYAGAALCAIICATQASKRGYSGVLWGILGFLFGLIPTIIVFCLKDKNKEVGSMLNMPLPPPESYPYRNNYPPQGNYPQQGNYPPQSSYTPPSNYGGPNNTDR